MWKNTSITSVTFRTACLPEVTDRQEKLFGFIQQALREALIILIGAGGLGGEIGEALVRKGVGTLSILDPDVAEPTNLNRQHFYERDLYKNKAQRLARNLAAEGFSGSTLIGHGLSFQDAHARGIDLRSSVTIVGVDNNPTRVAASVYYRQLQTPVIFTAVSRTANNGYVFVQEAGEDKPCFGCLFPDAINDQTWPCPGTPAVKDILKVVAGIVVYGVDSLLMERKRFWNYKEIFLDSSIPGRDWMVAKREECQLCMSN